MEPIEQLSNWLSTFPYENLTKRLQGFPRNPRSMIEERENLGAGGTCFSLVNLAHSKADDLGIESAYYLGDRPHGDDRHCVIGFPNEGVFIDPGYLFFGPLPLYPTEPVSIVNPHNILHLEPESENRIKVLTERKNQKTWRYTLKNQPVSRDRFETAWKDSFGWDGVMDSVVMTRLTEEGMYCYLNGSLELISREERRDISLPESDQRFTFLGKTFDLKPSLLRKFENNIASPGEQ